MPLNIGSSAISKLYVGSSAVDKLYLGSNEVWSSFTEQGIVKSGAQDVGYFSWVPVEPMIISAPYPSTSMSGNGIVIKANVTVLISAAVMRNGTNGGNKARIMNAQGAVLSELGGGGTITFAPFTYTPTVDTVISLTAYASSGLGGNPTIPNDAGTHLTIKAPVT